MVDTETGNSNRISRAYIDSLCIETRYIDSVTPELKFTLYGEVFDSPIMTAALSHLDTFMFPGGCLCTGERGKGRKCGVVVWYGGRRRNRSPSKYRRAND